MLSTSVPATAFQGLALSSASYSSKLKPHFSSSSSMAAPLNSSRIAVVGDVHDCWNLEEDSKALQLLQPDLVLFTGDFGEENVELVQSVANLKFPKAVILGNHDAWYTQKFSGREKDRVQLQLECLGEEHVGYRQLDFPVMKVSIVGGRPFSCGGQQLYRRKLLSGRYGVHNMDESAKRIYKASLGTPEDHMVLFLAHNGPTGLGSNLDDICGKDWVPSGGDYGDPDLAQAISLFHETRKGSKPLIVFGHMHKELAYGNGLRKMIVVGPDDTIYLNAAIVPRVRSLTEETNARNSSLASTETMSSSSSEAAGNVRAFTLVDISDGRVAKITETWVSVVGDSTKIDEEKVLFPTPT